MYCSRLVVFIVLAGLLSLAPMAQAQIWSYDKDENNQDEWGSLAKDYEICESGKQQSPVQISFTQKANVPALVFHYGEVKAKLEQKDYTLAADIEGSNTLVDNGKTYKLAQLRLHSPSEHTVLGKFWPLEIQMIHQDAEGKTLILSVFAEVGQENAALQAILDHAPDKKAVSVASFNPQALLPPTPGYYAYTGSLTIPPCTEGVEWRILKQPISISHNQLLAVDKITGRNARAAQPIYVRTVIESGE
jgi:carbonic anhydrase